MKIPKNARREARRLFRSCFVHARFDEDVARATVQAVVNTKPRGYLAILTVFERLVRLEVARNTAIIEGAVEIPAEQRALLLDRLQQLYQRPLASTFRVNPGLIGGVRIAVGSDVWDGSVANRLEQLRTVPSI